LPVTMLIFSGPVILLLAFTVLSRLQGHAQQEGGHAAQLERLDEAKSSLAVSINYLTELQTHIKAQAEKQQRLSGLLASLESASKETTDELRRKLEAIAYVNRRNDMVKLAISFGLGVLASLIASAIWTVLQK